MRTTLNYLSFKLNNASSSVPSGSSDPVTGLPISTGTNSGDFVELTDAQALAVSDATVGTLYSGVYQRIKMNASLTGIAIGQALFWDRADTSDPYVVTNVSSSSQLDFAGVYIDTSTVAGNYVWIQATGRASCLMSGAGAVGDLVSMPITSTNEFVAAANTGDLTAAFVGTQLVAAGGAGDLGVVELRISQARY